MLLETHVPQTALGVTFGARLRSILLGLLERPLGHFDPKAAHGLRNGSTGDPLGRQRRPGMPCRPYLDMLAASS